MALRENPSVEEALVVGRKCGTAKTQLVAYIVTRGRSSPSISDLLEFAQAIAFRLHDALRLRRPRRAAVDGERKGGPQRAPRPRAGTTQSGNGVYGTPRDTVESEMSHIWSGILGIEPISVTDNSSRLVGTRSQRSNSFRK